MISISMTTINTNGNVLFEENSKTNLGLVEARVSRTATLDGGCVITNSGVFDSDRTFNIRASFTKNNLELLEYIHENSILVLVSCLKGLFLGAISKIDSSNTNDVKIIILIKDKEF